MWHSNVARAALLSAFSVVALSTVEPALAGEEEANILMVEAVQALNSLTEASSPKERLAVYEQALLNLETIVSEHPSSGLAVTLVTGQSVGNINISDLKREIFETKEAIAESERARNEALAMEASFRIGLSEEINRAAIDAEAGWTFDYPPISELPQDLTAIDLVGWEKAVSRLGAGTTLYLIGQSVDFDTLSEEIFAFEFTLGPSFDGDLKLDEIGLVLNKGEKLLRIDEPFFGGPFASWAEAYDFYADTPVAIREISFRPPG